MRKAPKLEHLRQWLQEPSTCAPLSEEYCPNRDLYSPAQAIECRRRPHNFHEAVNHTKRHNLKSGMQWDQTQTRFGRCNGLYMEQAIPTARPKKRSMAIEIKTTPTRCIGSQLSGHIYNSNKKHPCLKSNGKHEPVANGDDDDKSHQ